MLWIALITLPLASAVLSKDSAVTLNTRGVLETVKHANDSKLVHHAGPRAAKERSLVMVDAGSSGSKLSSYHGADSQTIKVLTDCTNTNMPLKGVSALAYDMKECDAEVHVVDVNKETTFDSKLVDKETYAAILLEKLRRVHECGSLASTCEGATAAAATNRGSIPILATAGMRLLTNQENQEVWSRVCGRNAGDYKFAQDGNCGTISGTQEAYYEFLAANLKKATPGSPMTATVTIGGESAQIAVPLRDNQKLKWFADLYGNFTKVVKNCKSIQLPNGDEPRKLPIPTFNKENCARDFIDIRLIPDYIPTSNQGYNIVGLISLLGLEGLTGGIGVAGGMNAIEKWAGRVGCAAPVGGSSTFEFDSCWKKLQEALSNDQLFSLVAHFFKQMDSWLGIEWTFGTPAAIPSARFKMNDDEENDIKQKIREAEGAGTDSARMQAFVKMKDWLTERYDDEETVGRFGFNDEQTPMKSLFVYEYWAALNLDKWTKQQARNLTQAALKASALQGNSLKFHPLQWTDGKLAEIQHNPGGIAEMSDADFQSLLRGGYEHLDIDGAIQKAKSILFKPAQRRTSQNPVIDGAIQKAASNLSEPVQRRESQEATSPLQPANFSARQEQPSQRNFSFSAAISVCD
mmetsp:Transcript_159395/g.293790  ORF Transcript_159395/g.293790 Transcript_159395/m.293790 type:complete len:633 (-) Transcript_159395:30-1928(-)